MRSRKVADEVVGQEAVLLLEADLLALWRNGADVDLGGDALEVLVEEHLRYSAFTGVEEEPRGLVDWDDCVRLEAVLNYGLDGHSHLFRWRR